MVRRFRDAVLQEDVDVFGQVDAHAVISHRIIPSTTAAACWVAAAVRFGVEAAVADHDASCGAVLHIEAPAIGRLLSVTPPSL